MTDGKEIAIVGKVTPAIFGTGEIDPILDKIEKEVRSYHADVTTPAGRKEIASTAHKIATSKTTLDEMGKSLTDEARIKVDKINAERRAIRNRLDALKAEVRAPLTEFEDREKNRVSEHELGLAALTAAGTMFGDETSEQLQTKAAEIEKLYTSRDWQEYQKPAATIYDGSKEIIEKAITTRLKHDAEQAELARLRQEAEERAAKERDERIAKEAAAEAKAKAEKKAKEEREVAEAKAREERDAAEARRVADEERIAAAENARKDAEKEAKRAADEATKRERERVAAEAKAQAEETARREADKKHRAKVNNAAVAGIKKYGAGNVDEAVAKNIVAAIVQGKIPNVTISY